MDAEDRGELPVFPTDDFIGRSRELRQLRRLLQKHDSRLVSITGPAGVGKTRLALELLRDADEWFDGQILVVRLAGIERPEDIIAEIARTMGIVDQAENLPGAVQRGFNQRPGILLLDNLEHLLPDAMRSIDWLLASCQAVTVLVTTRFSLGTQPGYGDRDRALSAQPWAIRRICVATGRGKAVHQPGFAGEPAVPAASW